MNPIWLRRLLLRIGGMALTMLTVSLLVYGVPELSATDVAVKVLGLFCTPLQRTHWLTANGYDAPVLQRYALWLGSFLRGDWGRDPLARRPHPVGDGAVQHRHRLQRAGRQPHRPGAVNALHRHHGDPHYASCPFPSAIFVVGLRWLPGASTMTDGIDARQLLLPVMVLSLYSVGYVARITRARITRAAMRDELCRPYVRTALLKGALRRRIVLHHALRNALIAPVTVIMTQIPWLLSGMIVVEVFFAYRLRLAAL